MSTWAMVTVPTRIGHNVSTAWPCQRCDFYVPRDSSKAQALEANAHNQRLLEQIPVTETERKALAGDRSALEELVKVASTDASALHS
jgi:hypothetical protein